MMIYVWASLGSLGVIVGLSLVLYAWFTASLRRYYGVVAQDLLTRWDAQLAELPEYDRDDQRAHPPVAVLEAILALPARRPRRFQLSSRA